MYAALGWKWDPGWYTSKDMPNDYGGKFVKLTMELNVHVKDHWKDADSTAAWAVEMSTKVFDLEKEPASLT